MAPEPPPDSEVFYRAILHDDWFDPDDHIRVKPEAFFRRRPKQRPDGTIDPRDEDGLSLFRASRISPEECARGFNRCFGVVSIERQSLCSLGLQIVPDPEDDKKVLVINVPYENPGDAVQEHLVGKIAEATTIVLKGEFSRNRL